SFRTVASDVFACSAGHDKATAENAENEHIFSLRSLRALRLCSCHMRLDDVNALDEESAARMLQRCCGSSRWAQAMVRARPFPSAAAMMDLGDAVWVSLDAADWFEAFAAHPRIGETSSGSGTSALEGGGPAGVWVAGGGR